MPLSQLRGTPANPLFLRDEAIDLSFEFWLLAQAAIENIYRTYLSERDLDPLDFAMMTLIERHQGLNLAFLVEWSGRPKQVISRRIQLLEAKNLIERIGDPLDRRRRLLRLSDDGKAVTSAVMPMVRKALRRAFSKAGGQAVEGFAAALVELAGTSMTRKLGYGKSHE